MYKGKMACIWQQVRRQQEPDLIYFCIQEDRLSLVPTWSPLTPHALIYNADPPRTFVELLRPAREEKGRQGSLLLLPALYQLMSKGWAAGQHSPSLGISQCADYPGGYSGR